MKRRLAFGTLLAAAVCIPMAGASLPPDIKAALQELDQKALFIQDPKQLPKHLRVALATTFGQRNLELADHHVRLPETPYIEEGEKPGPERKLIFAFRAGCYWVVYYEHSYPFSGDALIYSGGCSTRARLLWGGVDFNRPYARTPLELRSRILKNRLLDDQTVIW